MKIKSGDIEIEIPDEQFIAYVRELSPFHRFHAVLHLGTSLTDEDLDGFVSNPFWDTVDISPLTEATKLFKSQVERHFNKDE